MVSIPLPTAITVMEGTTQQPKDQVTTHQLMIESLMHPVTGTRPDLAYRIPFFAQFSSCPTKEHIKSAKNVFRYVNETRNLGLCYSCTTMKSKKVNVNTDFAGCLDTRRSTSGYIVLFNNCLDLLALKETNLWRKINNWSRIHCYVLWYSPYLIASSTSCQPLSPGTNRYVYRQYWCKLLGSQPVD